MIFMYGYICVMTLMVCVYKQYIIQENNRLFRKPPLLGPPLSLPDLWTIEGGEKSPPSIMYFFL